MLAVKHYQKKIKFWRFQDFRATGAQNLFLDSNSIPRTFNALEAKLGTTNKRKRYNEVATEVITS